MPWHWSSQAEPASAGGLAAAEPLPLGSAQRWGAGLRISGLEVLLQWPGDFKGNFWHSREMLQYTSKLEPWKGGGVSSYLCHRLSGITLVKALCFACPAAKQSHGSHSFCAAKSACAQSLAGKEGKSGGGLHKHQRF